MATDNKLRMSLLKVQARESISVFSKNRKLIYNGECLRNFALDILDTVAFERINLQVSSFAHTVENHKESKVYTRPTVIQRSLSKSWNENWKKNNSRKKGGTAIGNYRSDQDGLEHNVPDYI